MDLKAWTSIRFAVVQLVQVVAAEELDPIPYGAYLPAPHKEPVQTADPESALYLPAGHDAPMRLTIVWRWCSYLDLRATADERTDLGV